MTNGGDAPYSGYRKAGIFEAREDAFLTHVGPGTPGGEYMRRFWHPVALSAEVQDDPNKIRILGEDLVVYRDKGNVVGLLHEKCAHRGASLEYGVCEARGLRCCYHGWLFDADGTILETPGEPVESPAAERLRARLRQGAYPVVELDEIIFAYLGPPEEKPPIPIFDSFDIAGTQKQPYARDYPCNWLQITENAMDPVHAVFLHARATGPQFSEAWGQQSVKEFHARETGFYYTNARQVEDKLWVRLHEIILPNITHAGAVMSMDGRQRKYFGRNSFTRWVVPVDDGHSRVIAWANFGARTDPPKPEWRSDRGIDIIESGMPRDRTPEEARRFPSDYEAFIGQGPIARHAIENLAGSDRGVALFRRRLRADIAALEGGTAPYQPSQLAEAPIPTYCGDTVLVAPLGSEDPEATLLARSRAVLDIIQSGDALKGEARDRHIIDGLKALEASLKN